MYGPALLAVVKLCVSWPAAVIVPVWLPIEVFAVLVVLIVVVPSISVASRFVLPPITTRASFSNPFAALSVSAVFVPVRVGPFAVMVAACELVANGFAY